MPLEALLQSLEASTLGASIRSLGGWGYGLINLAHILSIATLFGAILILDLRLLGWRRYILLGQISSITLPLAIAGFAGAVITGVCMISVNATEYSRNPFLLIKFVALFFALANAGLIRRTSGWKNRNEPQLAARPDIPLAAFGLASLLCWLTVIAAGRLIAYW